MSDVGVNNNNINDNNHNNHNNNNNDIFTLSPSIKSISQRFCMFFLMSEQKKFPILSSASHLHSAAIKVIGSTENPFD